MERIVVVGASLAGLRTAEALRAHGHGGDLVLIGSEPDAPYDRPPLSKQFLRDDAPTSSLAFTTEVDAEMRLGVAAAGLDTVNRRVLLEDGPPLDYDGLVIATGTSPITPAGVDTSLAGVHTLRTAEDARGLRADLRRGPSRVVVLGAGFIGGEIASTCHALGLPVSLVDMALLPLERPLGPEVARVLMQQHEQAGTSFHLGLAAVALEEENGRVSAVRLSDGSAIPADVVVVAIGVRPATGWLEGSGVALDDGVACRADLSSTTAQDVVAVGDVARWDHPIFGARVRVEHWMNAVEGAAVAAGTLLGDPRPHAAVPSFWSDQLGTKIQGIGLTSAADSVEVDTSESLYAEYFRGGDLVGAVCFGKPRRLLAARRHLAALTTAT